MVLVNEWQAQNLLVEINSDSDIKRFVSRDFIDSYVDVDIRKKNNLPIQNNLHRLEIEKKGEEVYYGKHSFLFDFKFGEYVLSPLSECFSDIFSQDKNNIDLEIKNIFLDIVKTKDYEKILQDYFKPKNVMYCFDNTLNIHNGSIPKFIKKHELRYR